MVNEKVSLWVIGHAVERDAKEILHLQRLAYTSEQALYPATSVPAMTQTLSDMVSEIAGQTVLRASFASDPAGPIVGSVRARSVGDVCIIGRLIVHPDAQCRGLGPTLLAAVEALFSEISRYEVFTGHKSMKNLNVYAKAGYLEAQRKPVSPELTLIVLHKARSCTAT